MGNYTNTKYVSARADLLPAFQSPCGLNSWLTPDSYQPLRTICSFSPRSLGSKKNRISCLCPSGKCPQPPPNPCCLLGLWELKCLDILDMDRNIGRESQSRPVRASRKRLLLSHWGAGCFLMNLFQEF